MYFYPYQTTKISLKTYHLYKKMSSNTIVNVTTLSFRKSVFEFLLYDLKTLKTVTKDSQCLFLG